ncbi:MAG: HNH endonuclease [Oscillospiraceae bacterium]
MPRKPKHPCHYRGCPELTESRFCEKHTKLSNKNYEKYERPYNVSERYGKNWRRTRNTYIRLHPLCEDCLELGLTPVNKSEEVHHILPKSKGGSDDFSNLRALCKSCHSRHTAEEGDRWHNKAAEK